MQVTIKTNEGQLVISDSVLERGFKKNNGTRINAALDAIESVVLAHHCSGVNVTDGKYIEGINSALDAITNNLD